MSFSFTGNSGIAGGMNVGHNLPAQSNPIQPPIQQQAQPLSQPPAQLGLLGPMPIQQQESANTMQNAAQPFVPVQNVTNNMQGNYNVQQVSGTLGPSANRKGLFNKRTYPHQWSLIT